MHICSGTSLILFQGHKFMQTCKSSSQAKLGATHRRLVGRNCSRFLEPKWLGGPGAVHWSTCGCACLVRAAAGFLKSAVDQSLVACFDDPFTFPRSANNSKLDITRAVDQSIVNKLQVDTAASPPPQKQQEKRNALVPWNSPGSYNKTNFSLYLQFAGNRNCRH